MTIERRDFSSLQSSWKPSDHPERERPIPMDEAWLLDPFKVPETVVGGSDTSADSASEESTYLWSDLLARRTALGLHPEVLAEVLDVDLAKYWSREAGNRGWVGGSLVEELIAMETFVDQLVGMFVEADADQAAADDDDEPIVLYAVGGQAEFEKAHPGAATIRDKIAYPFTLQHVAVGRAAAELTRRGHRVEVYRTAGSDGRSDRRADLMVRRVAVGLTKNGAGVLLGLAKKKYYDWENGTKKAPASLGGGTLVPSSLLEELQEIDDFIADSAARLKVAGLADAGITMVGMLDSEEEFQKAYPDAKTLRDGIAYPLSVHRVAAARRAQQLQAGGASVRIVGVRRA